MKLTLRCKSNKLSENIKLYIADEFNFARKFGIR
jgi:hypothetical protein